MDFSGTGYEGSGVGVVYGSFTNDGSFPDGLPGTNSYSDWEDLSADDYYLYGGGGGGGAGGDGQIAAIPVVSSLSSASGASGGGYTVTITGESFTGATAVSFGSVAATSFTVNSDTSITATVPAQPIGTVVDVTVTTSVCTSPTSTADQFSYVNGGPVGTSNTVTTLENQAYVFSTSDFGFTDPNNSPATNFQAVEITTLPGVGTLTDNGAGVSTGQYVSVSDISAGLLVYTPVSYTSGTSYDSFTFQVQNDGGTANGGIDTDPSAKTMTVNVTWVNQAPSGTSNTVTTQENTAYVFSTSDFGFTDPNDSPMNNFLAVKITTLPGAGSLTDNGVAVTAGQFVSVSDINAGLLVFTPAANAVGTPYSSFTFQVQDDGGTANGGSDLDPTPKTMTIDVLNQGGG